MKNVMENWCHGPGFLYRYFFSKNFIEFPLKLLDHNTWRTFFVLDVLRRGTVGFSQTISILAREGADKF